MTQHEPHKDSLVTDFFTSATPALCSGALQAVLFNPYDRALYLRVHLKRQRFLDARNFKAPFEGFGNAVAYRTIVGASYIFWQDSCHHWFRIAEHRYHGIRGHKDATPQFTPSHFPVLYPTMVGIVAGAVNGLALNNLQAIKFRMWSDNSVAVAGAPARGFFATAANMYQTAGIGSFFRGVRITVLRDVTFGLVYESLRHSAVIERGVGNRASNLFGSDGVDRGTDAGRRAMRRDAEVRRFAINLCSGVLGTVASSPINYLRSVVYGTPLLSCPIPMRTVIRYNINEVNYVLLHGHSFATEAAMVRGANAACSVPSGARHWAAGWRCMNAKLNIGWGSLRVGLGMASGQFFFARIKSAMTV